LTVADIEEWVRVNGPVPNGSFALLYSGWGQYYGNLTAFLGKTDDNPQSFHFPSFSVEAANWLYDNHNVSGLGVDTPATDAGNNPRFPNHVNLSPKRVLFLENIANLDQVPAKDFTLYVMPIKLRGGTGGPARIFAILDETAERSETQETES